MSFVRLVIRVCLGLVGAGGVIMGIFALSHLGDENLDSPRWWFVIAGLIGVGCGAAIILWAAGMWGAFHRRSGARPS